MEWVRLILDFAARVAWPALATVVVLAYRRPLVELLSGLAERIKSDLEAAEVAGFSAKFRAPTAVDTKVIEAAKLQQEQVEPGGENIRGAVVAGYIAALAAAFEEWYRNEAFDSEEPEAEHRTALLTWVSDPRNALVTTYSTLEKLAKLLAGRGWSTTPPPPQADFDNMRRRNPQAAVLRQYVRRSERQRQRKIVARIREEQITASVREQQTAKGQS
jgi:hypothetical protein